ncbi:hypothetical protein [Streptomyces griseoluteus]|uniref:hypothetical protein n=1 Tax=Streptomyces griseoluteus TaxID=29306 RepID=UPI0036FF2234
MSLRVLSIELKRSVAPWAGAMSLATALTFLLSGSGQGTLTGWTAQWTSLALQTRFLLNFLWPLAMGLGALQGLRDHRSKVSELLTSTPRPASHRAASLSSAMAITLASAFAVLVLVGGVQVVARTEYTHLGWLPISLVGALALAAGAVLGMGVGRTLPFVLTPPALAVSALACMQLVYISLTKVDASTGFTMQEPNRLSLLSPAQEARDVLLTLSTSVHVGQMIWLLGMTTTGFALLVTKRLRNRLIALTPILVGAAIALCVFPSDPHRMYVVDKAAAHLVCDGPICVTRTHQARLDALAGPGKDALRRMRGALGDYAPVSVREDTDAWPDGSAPRWSRRIALFDFASDDTLLTAEGEELSKALVGDSLVPNCSPRAWASVNVSDISAQSIAVGWLFNDPEPSSSDIVYLSKDQLGKVRRVWSEFKDLPSAEQRTRVRAMYLGAVACKGDPLAVLDGGPA